MHRHSHTQMHRKYRHYTSAHTHTHTYAKERVLLSASTLTVPASAESTVLSTLPMGTALHLPLSHWHNKRVAVRNVKPETSRGKGKKHRNREGNKKRQRDRERGKENCRCSWSYQVQSCIHLTSLTFYYQFLLFFFSLSSFLLSESEILSSWDLSYFSSLDVHYRQIKRQGIMVASSRVVRERGKWGGTSRLEMSKKVIDKLPAGAAAQHSAHTIGKMNYFIWLQTYYWVFSHEPACMTSWP